LTVLLFDPEDGGDVSLRNVWLSPNTRHYNPEDRALQTTVLSLTKMAEKDKKN
jgi:hypothetical protein